MPKPAEMTGLIGIDLGTDLLMRRAPVARRGWPQTIPNREGDLITPSVLRSTDRWE